MSTVICGDVYPASQFEGFSLAHTVFLPILPALPWKVSYSPSMSRFRCSTKVESPDSKPNNTKLIQLVLQFALTKDGELYAESITASRSNSTGSWNGNVFKELSNEVLAKYGKEWRSHLRSHHVRVEYDPAVFES